MLRVVGGMLCAMSTSIPDDLDDLDGKIIDIGPTKPKRNRKRIIFILAVVILLYVLVRSVSIYISALWFDSLGYSTVYWYVFRSKLFVFLIFAALTIAILRAVFWLLERTFSASALERRTIMVNNQAVQINPGKLFRPVAWVLSVVVGIFFGLGMKDGWRELALYLNQPAVAVVDPIFRKSLGFYLFSLPVHQMLSKWLIVLSILTLILTVLFAALSSTQKQATKAATSAVRGTGYAAVSFALAAFLLLLAWRVYLSRFPFLWEDHQSFSGVTYTEANHYIPGLTFVVIALILAAAIIIVNGLTGRRIRILVGAVALPVLTYVIAGMLIPAYVQSFVVKPNELGRETPYIKHNIEWTRRAFGLDRVVARDFDADTSDDPSATMASFDLDQNRSTLDNIRLWDWRALHDTLRQEQGIRDYYEFPDVDVDRYRIGGQPRQVMLAARELDVTKLPEQSRNWINEKLIYTHGYGVTMNTSNEFLGESKPKFVLSNMPIESIAQEDIKVTRPEIYFGQKTDTNVYVKTKQQEFNYPQGATNSSNVYEGTGGIPVGGYFRRLLLAWALNDLSKLPFSDDVTSESRVLIHRNIKERVQSLAPFLVYDNDPYIVVSKEGRLFWIIDAFTESSNYPYSRHFNVGDQSVNYIRNSVKVTIDAYDGSVAFYVFEPDDPIIKAYSAIFPALFRPKEDMPPDLRAHIRYPETLIRTQGDVYSLYHTEEPSVFFQRDDAWSVARQANRSEDKSKDSQTFEPYFVLMRLPGEAANSEFVEILPFTPANRPNMISWMAGRSDGDAYGSLLVYNFPKSKTIVGPQQIEANIDQDPEIASKITLWNQQGSRVLRGNLLVIPIGTGLLYVEPIYLQAQSYPRPQLQLVVLATQKRLKFGEAPTETDPRPAFDKAWEKMFGQKVAAESQPKEGQVKPTPTPTESPQPQQNAPPVLSSGVQQLINRAADDLANYQRLTAEGKLGEAGQKLDSLKRTLEDLRKATGKQ
ncbi:MAG: uncharacterized protein QOJ64_3108 [Acidobacteriota bacterium]|nr:uncharacterized protein [Acidobacteriota bacterium]